MEISQIIIIKYLPAFEINKDDERECLIALGKIKENMFLIKLTDNKPYELKYKKYIKKKDILNIIDTVKNSNEISSDVEVLDLRKENYENAKNKIENVYLEMQEIFKNS